MCPRPLALVVLLTVAVAGMGLGTAAASAATCKPGQVSWTIEGRARCVKATPAPATLRPASAVLVERVLRAAAQPPAVGKRSGLSAAARRRIARAAPRIARLAGAFESRAKPPTPRAFAALRLQAREFASQAFTEGGLSGRFTASNDAAGNLGIGIEAAVKDGKDTVSLDLDITPGFDPPTESCPDAEGRVRTQDTTGFRMTTKTQRGRKVISAWTGRNTTTAVTVGQVGPDGFLQGTTSTVTTRGGSFSRGYSSELTSTVTVAGGKEGAFTATGTPKIDARIRAADASAAAERAAERSVATDATTSQDATEAAAADAERGRNRVREREKGWTDLGRNPCIDVAWSPGVPGALETGQVATVTGRVVRKDGAPAAPATSWTVIRQDPGTFVGAGPVFTATAGERGGSGDTVVGVVVVASRSGRVQAPWFAKGSDLPQTFTATMTQKEVMPDAGIRFEFDLTGRWERTTVQATPDGSRTVQYEVRAATVPRWAYEHGVGGCVYRREGSGGTPVFGDVELLLGPDGRVAYGFVLDVDLGQQTIPLVSGPSDPPCPTSESPNLKAIVQARRKPRSDLFAAPGALQGTRFDVTQPDTGETIGDTDGIRDLATRWTLTGR